MVDGTALVYDVLAKLAADSQRTKLGVVRQYLKTLRDGDKIADKLQRGGWAPFVMRPIMKKQIMNAFRRQNEMHDLGLTEAQASAVTEWAMARQPLLQDLLRQVGSVTAANTDASRNFTRNDFDALARIFTVQQQSYMGRQIMFYKLQNSVKIGARAQTPLTSTKWSTSVVTAGIAAAAASAVTAYILRSTKR